MEYRLQPAGRRVTRHGGIWQKNGGQKNCAALGEGETCGRMVWRERLEQKVATEAKGKGRPAVGRVALSETGHNGESP